MGPESIVVFVLLGTLGVFHAVVLVNASRQDNSTAHLRSPIRRFLWRFYTEVERLRLSSLEKRLEKIKTRLERATAELAAVRESHQVYSNKLQRLQRLSTRKRKKHLTAITLTTSALKDLSVQAQEIVERAQKVQA